MRVRTIALLLSRQAAGGHADLAGVSHASARAPIGGAPVSIEPVQGPRDRGTSPRARYLTAANRVQRRDRLGGLPHEYRVAA